MRVTLLGLAACAALLLAALTVATLWRASVRAAQAEAAFPPEGQFIEVRGTRVHYVDQGDGPPVVLIHGASGSTRDWTFDMAARLSPRYRVIVMDRPGLGYTEMIGRNASAADQARLLADAARALGAERPIVVGHSYGGAVALAWALERPENLSGLLVLSGASNLWEGGLGLYYGVLGNPVLGPIAVQLIQAWVPSSVVESSVEGVFAPQSAPEGYIDYSGPELALRPFSMLENARHRTTLRPQIEAMVPRYPSISVPTEILHGDADGTVPLQIHALPLSQQIPDANLVVMEGVGHMPHHVQPQVVVDAIDRLQAARQR